MQFDFKTQPYAHQLAQFERHKDAEHFALFNDMGTGKTKIVIDIAAYKYVHGLIDAVLIIAPNHVHEQWIKEQFPLHCSVIYRHVTWSASRYSTKHWREYWNDFCSEPMPFLKVFSVNVEAFQSNSVVPFIAEYVQTNRTFIVIDEATRIKHHTAKRTKVIHKLNKYGQRAILTGTPTAKSPFDLWSMMEFLQANYFQCNFFVFQHRYGVLIKGVNGQTGAQFNTLIDQKQFNLVKSKIQYMKEDRGGQLQPNDYEALAAITGTSEKNVRFIETQETFTRFKRLDELKEFIAKDVSSVRKEDCLDLPPKVYEKIFVDMTKEQKQVYNDLRKTYLAQYADKELTVQNKVSLTTRLMQIVGGFFPYTGQEERIDGKFHYMADIAKAEPIGSANTKLRAIIDDMEETSEDTQLIIWAHFVPELKMLYAEMSKLYTCALYYGGTSNNERENIKRDFIAGKYRIFIGNTATAGFGLNLQCSTLQYFYSNTFMTEERLQSEDRSHRIGVKGTVVYKDIIMKGTIDERIYENITAGRNLNDYFKDVSVKELFAEIEMEDEDAQ